MNNELYTFMFDLFFLNVFHVLWKTCVNLSKIASCCWRVYHFSLANTCVFYFHNVWFNFILYWILHRSQSLVTWCLIFSDSKKTEHLERLILGASSWWNGAKRCRFCALHSANDTSPPPCGYGSCHVVSISVCYWIGRIPLICCWNPHRIVALNPLLSAKHPTGLSVKSTFDWVNHGTKHSLA